MAEEQVFQPSKELVENSNIMAFMKKHGIADLDALLKRAEDLNWYWGEQAKELEWFKPYTPEWIQEKTDAEVVTTSMSRCISLD